MVHIAAGVEFPVILYNGERQINVGNIEINPTTDFHTFRTILKHMTGISHNNLTSYLVESPRFETQSDRRKILITNKADFNVLIREKNAYFLVVLKRSRRERRRRTNNRLCLELSPEDLFDYRHHYNDDDQDNFTTQDESCTKVEIWLHELNMQRMNNMNNLMMHENLNYEYDHSHVNENFPSVLEAYPLVERSVNRGMCQDCDRANRRGLKPEFHMCVYDEVIEGFFRSPAGPVSRPITMIVL
ncbi:hypothetical protein QVD17_11478 [Tagetes erecta]|uniref:DUF7138 domain-containing protein n=1 Tax=Tagetes erecta TaxID=13708 RepID=A0AAD8P239_TARER|nr:hypothetical protein QVD17_11478 [Tagetes erecta]